MIKHGVYYGVTKIEIEENHGGVVLSDYFYDHFCFYNQEKFVGFYGGGKDWFKPFLDRDFRYSGEILTMDTSVISLYINDPVNNDKFLFSGTHHDDELHLSGRRESAPDKVVFKDIYKFMGVAQVDLKKVKRKSKR